VVDRQLAAVSLIQAIGGSWSDAQPVQVPVPAGK